MSEERRIPAVVALRHDQENHRAVLEITLAETKYKISLGPESLGDILLGGLVLTYAYERSKE